MKAAFSLKDVMACASVLLVGVLLSLCQGLDCEEPPLEEEIENAIARGATMLRVQAVEGESDRRELPCGIGEEFPNATLSLYKVVTVFQGNVTQPFVHLMNTWPTYSDVGQGEDFLVTLGREILDCCPVYNMMADPSEWYEDVPPCAVEEVPIISLLAQEENNAQIFGVSDCGSRPEWSSLSRKERGLLESSSRSDLRSFMTRMSIGLATMFMVWK